jgi:hypothetical protein
MTTILIDGVAVETPHMVCDPLPGNTTGPVVLRFELPPEQVRQLESTGPIVFPLGGVFYRGEFRKVASTDRSDGGVEYTYISEGPVTERETHIWERPLERVRQLRTRLRARGSS